MDDGGPQPVLEVKEELGSTVYSLKVPLEWRFRQVSAEVASNKLAYFILRSLYNPSRREPL